MQVRPIRQLKAAQARMLETYKQDRLAAANTADDGSATATSETAIGRVDEVVSSDAQYGPHLKVALQQLTGSPPSPADANGAVRACYPAPGRAVTDYSTDEYVALIAVGGLRLAFKL